MKKVGIVTLLGNNYGGILQAYALKQYINTMNTGLKVQHINYIPKFNKKNIKNVLKNIIYTNRNIKFRKFKKKYLEMTEKVGNFDCLNFDYYIAGSDQIWNSDIDINIRKYYYLGFTQSKNKISYAASIGKSQLCEDNYEDLISNYLNDFKRISMREEEGAKVYQSLTNNKIETVIDPTLLLNKNEWDKVKVEYKCDKNYTFVYILGITNEYINIINDISEVYNLDIIELFYKKCFKKSLKCENKFGPSEFIGAIDNAKNVITNSFHGMVFSILYKKDFIVLTRGNMNSRMYNLLEKLGLLERIIKEEEYDANKVKNMSSIDYDKVEIILDKERKKSNIFLEKALDLEGK